LVKNCIGDPVELGPGTMDVVVGVGAAVLEFTEPLDTEKLSAENELANEVEKLKEVVELEGSVVEGNDEDAAVPFAETLGAKDEDRGVVEGGIVVNSVANALAEFANALRDSSACGRYVCVPQIVDSRYTVAAIRAVELAS